MLDNISLLFELFQFEIRFRQNVVEAESISCFKARLSRVWQICKYMNAFFALFLVLLYLPLFLCFLKLYFIRVTASVSLDPRPRYPFFRITRCIFLIMILYISIYMRLEKFLNKQIKKERMACVSLATICCTAPCLPAFSCGFGVSRIEPLCSPVCRKKRLMDAGSGLPAGVLPSVVKTLEPSRVTCEAARPSGNHERSSSLSPSSLNVFYSNYFCGLKTNLNITPSNLLVVQQL